MNEKGIREIRRRFRPDHNGIETIYGCYVNDQKQIISMFTESLPVLPKEESEKYLGLCKRTLSGTYGKNLLDIEFSTKQVMEGSEHKLLSALRASGLTDEASRATFFNTAIEELDLKGNYLILLTCDTYSVSYQSKDGETQPDASDEEFSYILCSVCPVKESESALSYYPRENSFHSSTQGWIVSPPQVGFLFPAYDDRTTNIYGALYYTKKPSENQPDFAGAIFGSELPMPADRQKETFEAILSETLADECDYEVVQAVHERISEMIETHKENKEPEPLTVSGDDIGTVLTACGVSEERIQTFQQSFAAQFGEDKPVAPTNVINAKRFEIKTDDAVIRVDPARSDLVETRMLNGRPYILIPANGCVLVNGVPIKIEE